MEWEKRTDPKNSIVENRKSYAVLYRNRSSTSDRYRR